MYNRRQEEDVRLNLDLIKKFVVISFHGSEVKDNEYLDFSSIIGVKVENPIEQRQPGCLLRIVTFAKVTITEGCCRSVSTKRQFMTVLVQFRTLQEAEAHRIKILWALEGKEAQAEAPRARKMLILANPFGGAGAAARNWLVAKPFFDVAHVDYTLRWTERANHAHDIVHAEL